MATYTTTSAPLPWMEPYLRDYMGRAQEVANTRYEQAPGTYTGPNDLLTSAWQMTANRAMQGSADMNAARGELLKTLGGAYANRQAATGGASMNQNAGATNDYARTTNANADAYNRNAGVLNEAANVANPYASLNNPYLTDAINSAQGDLVRNYNLVNKPAWDKAMQSSGSFGNTGVMEYAQNDRNDLMKNMGRIGTDMRMGAYGLGANLAEGQVGRQFSAGNQVQQNLFGAGEQQAQNLFNAGNQLQQNLYNYGNQQMMNKFNAGAQYAQAQTEASLANAAAQNAVASQERSFMNNAMALAPTFANQDYTDINNLMNVGAQQQGFNQAYQNQQQQFFNDRRNFPQQQLDAYGRALGTNVGATSTQQAPDPSKASQVLGGALTGAGIYNLLTRP